MPAIENLFSELGIGEKEAKIYQILLKLGQSPIQLILKISSFKRGTIYNILETLIAYELVNTKKVGKKTLYAASPPGKLQDLVTEQEQQIGLTRKVLVEALPELESLYNLAFQKPGVRFFEGKKGIIQAYEELLDIREPIDSIEDKGEMAAFIPDYFPRFIRKRVERNIFNRVVAPSTNKINITSEKEKRETRTIPLDQFPFSMDIKICKNTILFVTFKNNEAVAIRVDHPVIAENFKLIFKFFWDHAARRSGTSSSSSTSLLPPPNTSLTDAAT